MDEEQIPIVSVPGPMVSARISPEQFAAYLLAKGWVEIEPCDNFRQFNKGSVGATVPRHSEWPDWADVCARDVEHVARVEKRPAYEVLREIAEAEKEKP
jgi:hypothetical protein